MKAPRQNVQRATITESFEVQNIVTNTPYSFTFDISSFARATAVGKSFQMYKPTSVQLEFEPFFNTYQDAATTPLSIPQFLGIMDRTGRSDAWSRAVMEQLGCKPIKFISNIKRTFQPNTLNTVQINSNLPRPQVTLDGTMAHTDVQSSEVVFKKWISTQWDCTDNIPAGYTTFTPTAFYGYTFIIDQSDAVVAQNVGKLTVTVTWEFKEAAIDWTGTVPATKVTSLVNKLKNISVTSPLQEEKK